MKRFVTVVAAITLVAGACGSGDDSSSNGTADETTEEATFTDEVESSEETAGASGTADDAADATADQPSAEEPTVDEPTADEPTDDDENSGPTIRSIDDIPQVCRDEMAKFLRAIEPIVSPIDWEGATFADFEQVSADFEAVSEEFDTAAEAAGCNELNFDGDAQTELLIEFARSEAPGAVEFLEFVEQLRTSTSPDGDPTADAAFETCQDAIDFLQELIDGYASIAEVPASEFSKIAQLGAVVTTCTPEQLEFFDNPELNEFMDG